MSDTNPEPDGWVVGSSGGTVWHQTPDCPQLKRSDPRQLTDGEVSDRDLRRCRVCHGPNPTRPFTHESTNTRQRCPRCDAIVRDLPAHIGGCDGQPERWLDADGRYHVDRSCDDATDIIAPILSNHAGGEPGDPKTIPGCRECSPWASRWGVVND